MTSRDVCECLSLLWPDSEYLLIPEAPESPDRGGRKIDLLVVALWRSRGLDRDAVEVKVSLSDWRRELRQAAKADFWWRHSHRFWVAVPSKIADTVANEAPKGWGVLSCSPGERPTVAVKPEVREAEPLPWSTTVGVLRAASDCGANALSRAEARGRQEGVEIGRREGANGHWQRAHEALAEKVRRFEAASGLEIGRDWDIEGLGRAVAIVRAECRNPGHLAESVGWNADSIARSAQAALEHARELRALAATLTEAIAAPETEVTE